MLFTNQLNFNPSAVGGVAALISSASNGFDITNSYLNQTLITVPGYFDSLYVQTNATISTPDLVVTLYQNGSPTALSIDIPNGSSGTADFSDTVFANEGDQFTLVLVSTGDTGIMNISLRFTEN